MGDDHFSRVDNDPPDVEYKSGLTAMPDYCPTCDRPVQEKHQRTRTHRPIVSVSYRHDGYGCDTGCCGHVLFAVDDRGNAVNVGQFEFMHDKDDLDQRLAALSDHLSVPIDPPPEFVED